MDNATQLAPLLGVNVQWLLTGKGPKGGAASCDASAMPPEAAIQALLGIATPRGAEELAHLARIAQAGELEEADLKVLQAICERYKDRH